MNKHSIARCAVSLAAMAALAALGGCAVVPYQQADYPAPYLAPYPAPGPAYAAPIYAAPAYPAAPVYAGPPVYFGFDFLYRGGGGHRHGRHHQR